MTKITADNIEGTTLGLISGPRISSITYPGNDTATDPAGGATITLNGAGFQLGLAVYVDGTVVSVATVTSVALVTFTAPAKSAGSYSLYLVNPDGGTATFVPGIQYSGLPTWSTAAGSLGTADAGTEFSSNLTASSDSTVTYSVASGALPPGVALDGSTGVISGTLPDVPSSTTYNFTIAATDIEYQDTNRTFSITVNSLLLPGQVAYTTAGTYSFVVPAGITALCAVLVGPGGAAFTGVNGSTNCGGGGGGGLRYVNNLPVTPGETLTVVVGLSGNQTSSSAMSGSTNTTFSRGADILVQADAGGTGGRNTSSSTYIGGGAGGGGTGLGAGPFGGTIGGGNGGAGGGAKGYKGGGGGGAAGYSGDGGLGGSRNTGDNIPAGTNGAGGGGAGGSAIGVSNGRGAGGGGVGLLGEGSSGVIYGNPGSGGSGPSGRTGGGYGAGGGGSFTDYTSGSLPTYGGSGAVRIIWGPGRSFPLTNTADQ